MSTLPGIKRTETLRLVYVAMEFRDTAKQKKADAEAIFARAKSDGVRAVAGSEAGAGSGGLSRILRRAARRHGYRFFFYNRQDSWVAVQKRAIRPGTIPSEYYRKYIDGEAKKNTDRGVFSVTYEDVLFGEVTLITAHFLTKGRPSGNTAYRVNLARNRVLANAIVAHALEKSRGRAISFFLGDTNIVDRVDDPFFGGPLTTAGDELKKWPNTGHGPIDVIASVDKDTRVKAKSWKAYNDKVFPLHTDHFYTEAVFDVGIFD